MGKLLNKDIAALGIYILLFVGLTFGLSYISLYGGGHFFSYIIGFFRGFSQMGIFSVLFIFQQIILLGFIYVSFILSRRKIVGIWEEIIKFYKSSFNWNGILKAIQYGIGFYFIYLFLNGIFAYIVTKLGVSIPGFFGKQEVAGLIGGMSLHSRYEYFLLFLMVTIIGPLCEELIYRGFITKILIDNLGKFGIFLGAFIFAAVHMEWHVFGNLFILSLFLSYIYYKTRSIYYTFAFHFVVNFTAFVTMIFFIK